MIADALIFDFDGVLIDSEFVDNCELAATLTRCGRPTRYEDTLELFLGLSGTDFLAAIEDWLGCPAPAQFHEERANTHRRLLTQGIAAVAGAVAFVEALPLGQARAIASSSSSEWIDTHLRHHGIRQHFGDNLFSGCEHVARGKPSPDIYWYAADAMQVDIGRVVVIEDSLVGVTAAAASGARVIGLCAGRHCGEVHGHRLLSAGAHHVTRSFEEIGALLW